MEQMKLINMIHDVKAMKDSNPIVKVDGDDDEPMAAAKHVEELNERIELYINTVKDVKNEKNALDYFNYQEDVYGNTALIVAIQTGNEIVAKALIEAGADVTIQNNDGNTALIVAVKTGNEIVVKALIDAGADVTIKNNDKRTALFYAIRMNRPDIYNLLTGKKNLKSGGKKRKTKKGKRGNKSKESRKGKKSRKERKSRKGKKV